MTREDTHRRSGNAAEDRLGDMAIRDLLKNRLAQQGLKCKGHLRLIALMRPFGMRGTSRRDHVHGESAIIKRLFSGRWETGWGAWPGLGGKFEPEEAVVLAEFPPGAGRVAAQVVWS